MAASHKCRPPMSERTDMKAIQIETFGSPAEVVKAVDVPDVGAPAAGEVVIALEASPINPSDLLMIAGSYGYRPRLPAIMGTEGVGRVVAAGAGVKQVKEGDRTLVPFPHPAWAARILGHPEWRQFGRRAGNGRGREIAWIENGQRRPSRRGRRGNKGARRRRCSSGRT